LRQSAQCQIPEVGSSAAVSFDGNNEPARRWASEKAEKLIHEHFDHAGRFLLESLIKQSGRGGEMRVTVPFGR
jgi:hypothetical protein